MNTKESKELEKKIFCKKKATAKKEISNGLNGVTIS